MLASSHECKPALVINLKNLILSCTVYFLDIKHLESGSIPLSLPVPQSKKIHLITVSDAVSLLKTKT